jgi:hypothetical protein
MWVRVGWAAACFAGIMGFSRLAYGVLVPAMRDSLGGSFATYGAIGGANMVGYLAGSFLTTRLARRPDRSRVNVAALLAMCGAMAACGLVREPILLGILRFAVGVASGIALALTLALAVEHVSPRAPRLGRSDRVGRRLRGDRGRGRGERTRCERIARRLAGGLDRDGPRRCTRHGGLRTTDRRRVRGLRASRRLRADRSVRAPSLPRAHARVLRVRRRIHRRGHVLRRVARARARPFGRRGLDGARPLRHCRRPHLGSARRSLAERTSGRVRVRDLRGRRPPRGGGNAVRRVRRRGRDRHQLHRRPRDGRSATPAARARRTLSARLRIDDGLARDRTDHRPARRRTRCGPLRDRCRSRRRRARTRCGSLRGRLLPPPAARRRAREPARPSARDGSHLVGEGGGDVAALDFARRRARNRIDHDHPARHFERREPPPA